MLEWRSRTLRYASSRIGFSAVRPWPGVATVGNFTSLRDRVPAVILCNETSFVESKVRRKDDRDRMNGCVVESAREAATCVVLSQRRHPGTV